MFILQIFLALVVHHIHSTVSRNTSEHINCILPNKQTVCLKKNWAMEKCQGICSYKHTLKIFSVNNKVMVVSFGDKHDLTIVVSFGD